MNWSELGALFGVVGAVVGFFGWIIDTRMENRSLKLKEAIVESIECRLRDELGEKSDKRDTDRVERRVDKLETDMRHVTASVARLHGKDYMKGSEG